MSDKEIQHLAVLQDVRDQRIIQVRAAEILNLSTRQITRLLQKLNQVGVSGLVHACRGQPGHRRHDEAVKSECLSLISEHLLGFGPTLAHEKLSSMFGLNIPVETVHRWMTVNQLWIPRSKRLKRPYQPRYNRDCFGELIQIDGSYHDWFEGRAAKCCLLVYTNDATGKLLHLRFCEAETTFGRHISEANAWLPYFIEQFNQNARNSKNLHRPLTESDAGLEDIFTWREPRRVTNSLTITYDKCEYLLENTEENQRLIGKYLEFLEYPDGTVAIEYQGRKINYSIFDKLSQLNQREIVENKRLGSVLAHIQQQHEELEQQNKRNRSQKMPSRRAQKTVIQQRNLNPVLDLGMLV